MTPVVFDTVVVIPTHPARGTIDNPSTLLGRAVDSVRRQTIQPRALSLAMDTEGKGAGWCRREALAEALTHGTEWVSFLDSDDFWYPDHLATHRRLLVGESGTEDLGDVAYSWFDGNGIAKEWEHTHRGKRWDSKDRHHITMTITVRASLAERAAHHFLGDPMHPEWTGEDWRFICALDDLGARFVGTGEITWHYGVHGGNTSGSPERGDAVR